MSKGEINTKEKSNGSFTRSECTSIELRQYKTLILANASNFQCKKTLTQKTHYEYVVENYRRLASKITDLLKTILEDKLYSLVITTNELVNQTRVHYETFF